MKVIIAGTRTVEDYEFVVWVVNSCPFRPKITEIVSGHGITRNERGVIIGVDGLGERYAREHDLPLTLFPADWQKYGRAAGPIRNEEMAKYSQGLIAIWDGQSRGTQDMIRRAQSHNFDPYIYVYTYKENVTL